MVINFLLTMKVFYLMRFLYCVQRGDTRGNALKPLPLAMHTIFVCTSCIASPLAPRGDVTRKPIITQDDRRVVRDDIPTMRTSFHRDQGYTTTYCRGDYQRAQ
ncbi:MAG: hypothetical protein ACFFC7_15105 [Candidatus Hermodarchaeota archaeon]